MRFTPSFLDEIRARLPVSQVVSRHVKMKRQGREFIGLSPFKQEKTPSFTVNDQKGFYHCFASGEHGDIFKFLMKTQGLSFPEAVEQLAGEAGVPMPKSTPEMEKREAERDRLLALLEDAARFFEAALQAGQGGGARDYLVSREVSTKTQSRFRMGFAPNSRSAIKEHLAQKGYSQEEMARSGMIISGDDIPVSYDRFRNRLIIPITDLTNRVIAFGGRALDANQPAKYLNSPETPLFHKGAVLYNMATARQAAYDKGAVIAVEGYMDVIALAAAGFDHAVAPLGTALTPDQINLLWRMAPEPILCFDGDAAGRKAAYRAVETTLPLLRPGFSLSFAFLPDGMDPDDLLRGEGAAAMRDILNASKPLVDMLWARETANGRLDTPERRAALENRIEALLTQVSEPKIRHHYERELRSRLRRLWDKTGWQGSGQVAWMSGQGAAHFGQSRWKGSGRRKAGSFGKQAEPAGRFDNGFRSQSLEQSAMVRGGRSGLSFREVTLLLTLMQHSWLIEDYPEEIAGITFESRPLAMLRDAVLAAQVSLATECPIDIERLCEHLRKSGLAETVDLVERTAAHSGSGLPAADASREGVRQSWRQMLTLHHKAMDLKKELNVAESAYFADTSEQNFARLREIRLQYENTDQMEAVASDEADGKLEPEMVRSA